MQINSASNQIFGAKVSERFQTKLRRKHGNECANYLIQELQNSGNSNTLISDVYAGTSNSIIAAVQFPGYIPENTYLINITPGQSIKKAVDDAEKQFIFDFIDKGIKTHTLQSSIFKIFNNFPEKKEYLNNFPCDINYELRNEEELLALKAANNKSTK